MNEQLIAMDAKTEIETVWNCFRQAVKRFNDSVDRNSLLRPRKKDAKTGAAASERAIAHRLAFYLESELRKSHAVNDKSTLVVDCEYNRHGGALKALAVEHELKGIVEKARNKKWDEPDEEGFYVFSVAPDIVVHQRGDDDRNRLVVEVKKATNPEDQKYDLLKLKLFTTPNEHDAGYEYNFGAWVVAEDKLPPDQRKLVIRKKFHKGLGEDFDE